MMPIVHAARRWIGTPYRHQSSCLGAGCDCLGLILGVWTEVVGDIPETLPAYSPDWSEPQNSETLFDAALRHFEIKPVANAEAGDLLLFRMRDGAVAKHLGIQSRIGSNASFIHSYSGHGVVESRLTDPWARRIVARFKFPIKVT
ncbi:peptidase [Marivivens niveibacter]|uniref:Peptidase n=1 Tax=Marivivens niveibacter TaxID=1930667 RepID=A0A251X2Z9_9RHOB|nr:NlpC/P60 family protein [Marivivens niveibacter]OUD10704.1 peptidase [Marivivens niveibacter]